MNKVYLILVCVSVAISLIKIIIKVKRKLSNNSQLEMHAEDKLREDVLDQYILNPSAPTTSKKTVEAKPFEVSYDAKNVEKRHFSRLMRKKREPKIMLQLIENSELSARKFVLDPSKEINIGSKKGRNDIVLSDPNVDPVQCNIIEIMEKVYVRNYGGSGKLILSRAGQRAFVEQKAIEIKNGDLLFIGETVFRLELIKTSK